MLVRLDPEKEAIAMMSLPRDLKVEIPGHGTDKINAAYRPAGPSSRCARSSSSPAFRSTT